MKKNKFLLFLLFVELLILIILNKLGIKITSWFFKAIGTALCLLPLQFLLFFLSKDLMFSEKKRQIFLFVFWFVNICFIGGAVLTALEMLNILPRGMI